MGGSSIADAISIVVADDHAVVRGALRALLDGQEDLQVLGEVGEIATAKAALVEHTPRVLVLDVNLPDGLAIDHIAAMRELAPETQIVLVTMERDPTLARKALADGALGYLFKDSMPRELIDAVRAAAAGRPYLPAAVAAGLAMGRKKDRDPLSPRETEVLRLMALGHTNRDVGEHLDLSVRTVETHRSHIQQKLGLSSRPELTRYALDHRLIDI
jgi:two-component system, NarL family, response regulator NreC